jgi:hypothetical protein
MFTVKTKKGTPFWHHYNGGPEWYRHQCFMRKYMGMKGNKKVKVAKAVAFTFYYFCQPFGIRKGVVTQIRCSRAD